MSWQGCKSTGQGWGKETDPKEETGLGDPNPQQSSTSEPGWSGWECTLAQPGRKMVLQQSQGDSPGSDHSISTHPHMMSEVSQFSKAFTVRGCAVPQRSVTRVYFCSSLSASTSEHGDLPASKLWDTSPATVKFPAPNSIWAEEDNPPHQKGQALQVKPMLQPFNRVKTKR